MKSMGPRSQKHKGHSQSGLPCPSAFCTPGSPESSSGSISGPAKRKGDSFPSCIFGFLSMARNSQEPSQTVGTVPGPKKWLKSG